MDNFANTGLVESFESVIPFEVLKVRSDGTLSAELLGLFGGDRPFPATA